MTINSWYLLRLTSFIKFAHVEVNNLDIRVSGSSRLIFRKVRFDCYFACTWFKLVYKYNYFAVNVKFWRRSCYMRVPRLYFLCFLMTMSSISALMVRFAFSTAPPMISCCHSLKQNSGTNHSHISECKGENNWRHTTHKHMTLFEDPPRYDPFHSATLGGTLFG